MVFSSIVLLMDIGQFGLLHAMMLQTTFLCLWELHTHLSGCTCGSRTAGSLGCESLAVLNSWKMQWGWRGVCSNRFTNQSPIVIVLGRDICWKWETNDPGYPTFCCITKLLINLLTETLVPFPQALCGMQRRLLFPGLAKVLLKKFHLV